MDHSSEAHIGLRVSESMVSEIDKLAAVQGVSRSDCVRTLIAEGLLRNSGELFAPLFTQALHREMKALEERLVERLAALEDLIDESKVTGEEARRMLGALLWFSSFDEHRDEGGQMDAWLRLALFESGAVLSGERLNDFDPVDGGC